MAAAHALFAIGTAEAQYLEGVAGRVRDAERTPALALLNSRLPQHQQLSADDLVEPGFDNVTDVRHEVAPDDDPADSDAPAVGNEPRQAALTRRPR